MEIKRLKAGDEDLAINLIKLFEETDRIRKPLPSKDRLSRFLPSETHYVIVALMDEQVAGGVLAFVLDMFKHETREMFLYEIGVAAAYRRQGIGAALIERLKRICRANDIDEMFVFTGSSNATAKRLYASTGSVMDDRAVAFKWGRDAFAE